MDAHRRDRFRREGQRPAPHHGQLGAFGLCPASWSPSGARLTQLASATLDVFSEYPAIGLEAIVLTTDGPAELEIVELILDAFRVAGLDGDDIVRHYAALSAYLLSYASGIAREQTVHEGHETEENRAWLGRSLPVTAATHPNIAALREQLLALRSREIFLVGVDALLDAAEAAVARRG